MKQAGCAILLVEQNVHQALTVCDQFAVIERGRIVVSGRANDKSDREKLLATIAV
jgi:branched-chain amino acid transport system ATP-binding protein